jgi:S-adenosylmethionine:tRNA ribosyltransferase-isomerase
VSAPTFTVPPELEASEPPEKRGIARDEVRLMVVHRSTGEITHATFRDLPDFLDPGDLLVINNSATLPAAVSARLVAGSPIELRFATPVPRMDERRWWVVELRSPYGDEPFAGTPAGERLALPGNGEAAITAPYNGGTRLWIVRHHITEPVEDYLLRYGHPIRYAYVPDEHPLQTYQTAFALHPGSAEMPSAARPFTPRLVTALVARGVLFAPITLHAGVSSPERDETPTAERYDVPGVTARLANAVHAWGGRMIAVGTTVARALETAATTDGEVIPGDGWTSKVIAPDRGLRAVDGLLTGWHEPEASHLRVLEAALGSELLDRSYDAAVEHGYQWHEFGDGHLILP